MVRAWQTVVPQACRWVWTVLATGPVVGLVIAGLAFTADLAGDTRRVSGQDRPKIPPAESAKPQVATPPDNPTALTTTAGIPDLDIYRTVTTAETFKIDPKATLEQAQPKVAGYVGLRLALSDAGRVVVAEVDSQSPAARAGLVAGDQLVMLAEQNVRNLEAAREQLKNSAVGQTLKLVVLRGTKFVPVEVTVAPRSRPMSTSPSAARGIMGIQVGEDPAGAKVVRLTSAAPAEKAGLRVGDIIISIEGQAIGSPEELTDIMTGRKPGETLTVIARRGDQETRHRVTLVADRSTPDLSRLANQMNVGGLRIFKKPVYRLAVVPIEFPDVKANPKIATADWDRALFSRHEYNTTSPTGQDVYGSLNDYYIEQSCGKLRVEGRVFDYVTAKKRRIEYSADANRFALLVEALDAILVRDGANALKGFDGLFFIYAGARQQTQRGGLYWPHRSMMPYKGTRWDYFICPEGGPRMDSISVIAHEFGHMLGMPDLYAKPENPGSEGLGVWCTMATGHGRDGKPLHFSAYAKERMGWLTPTVIDPRIPQKLLLSPIVDSTNECYKVPLRPDGSEYFLLENRRRRGFDRDLPSEGLLIWRVVDDQPVLEESHGVLGPAGPEVFRPQVPFPSRSNDAFTPETIPSSKPSKAGGGWPVNITNIRRLPDGRVAFQIGYEYQ